MAVSISVLTFHNRYDHMFHPNASGLDVRYCELLHVLV
jgi:hypothetical protein